MFSWLIKRYLKKHLEIKLQYWPMSENVQVLLLLDDDVIPHPEQNCNNVNYEEIYYSNRF